MKVFRRIFCNLTSELIEKILESHGSKNRIVYVMAYNLRYIKLQQTIMFQQFI